MSIALSIVGYLALGLIPSTCFIVLCNKMLVDARLSHYDAWKRGQSSPLWGYWAAALFLWPLVVVCTAISFVLYGLYRGGVRAEATSLSRMVIRTIGQVFRRVGGLLPRLVSQLARAVDKDPAALKR